MDAQESHNKSIELTQAVMDVLPNMSCIGVFRDALHPEFMALVVADFISGESHVFTVKESITVDEIREKLRELL